MYIKEEYLYSTQVTNTSTYHISNSLGHNRDFLTETKTATSQENTT